MTESISLKKAAEEIWNNNILRHVLSLICYPLVRLFNKALTPYLRYQARAKSGLRFKCQKDFYFLQFNQDQKQHNGWISRRQCLHG